MPSNREFMRSLYDAFARGDADTVLGALDPEIVWTEAENSVYADRSPYRGPQQVAEGVFMRLATEWDGFSVRPETFVEDGDTVVSFGRYRGTYKATGRPLDAQFAHAWTLRDGRITSFQQYTDTAQMARVTESAAALEGAAQAAPGPA
jgi:ketosteroid isomerase-like protein